MKERPILFSAPMVRAILDGRKTQTRRVVAKSNSVCTLPFSALQLGSDGVFADGPPERRYLRVPALAHKDDEEPTVWRVFNRNHVGDRLWVRETFTVDTASVDDCRAKVEDMMPDFSYGPFYRADMDPLTCRSFPRWYPSIHMPRWASRITLEITAVRVERLHDISEADATAEGIVQDPDDYGDIPWRFEYRYVYQDLWNFINGPRSWNKNPWVWVVEFRRVES